MKALALASALLVAASLLVGCSGEKLAPEDSVEGQLKAAHINPQGSSKESKGTKVSDGKSVEPPAAGSETGETQKPPGG